MTYGAGVPLTQTLAPRIARHLSVARPGLGFDCRTFGVPGACAFGALGRAESHAAMMSPDILVVALCANDAYMLRGEPPTLEEIGQTWSDFAPHLASAFADFVPRWRASGHTPRMAILYFDSRAQYGAARPADVLRSICDAQGLLFIDGSAALVGGPRDQLVVSPVDQHLNGSAHDKVARQVARALVTQQWLPPSPSYDDPAWIARVEESATSLADAGMPPAVAATEALSALRHRWEDRRNRYRVAHQHAFTTAEQRLATRTRAEWSPLALSAFYRHLKQGPSLADQLESCEFALYRANTLYFALRHAASTGALQQPTTGLVGTELAGGDVSPEAILALASRASDRWSRALDLRDSVQRSAIGRTFPDLCALAGLAARAAHVNGVTAPALTRLARLVPLLPPDAADAHRVLQEALTLWRQIDTAQAAVDGRLDWSYFGPLLAALTPERPTMSLTLTVTGDPGPEQWSYRVGVTSAVHAVDDTYVACGLLVRDGQAHVYSVDLPLMFWSTITVFVNGVGLVPEHGPRRLRLRPPQLAVPGLPAPLSLHNVCLTPRTPSDYAIEYADTFALARS